MRKFLIGINEETLECKVVPIEDIHNEFEDNQITYCGDITNITCIKEENIESYKRALAMHILKDIYNELQESYKEIARLNKLYIGFNKIILGDKS